MSVVILGGGYAGLMAAMRLARRARRFGIAVTLVDAGDTFTERIRLHQVAAGQRLRSRPYAALLAGTGVRFLQGRVTEIDPVRARTRVQVGSRTMDLPYDWLIYALGSRPDLSLVPGADQYAHPVADAGAAAAVAERLRELAASGGRVGVIGGGLTGIETAAEIAAAYPGLRIQLLTAGRLGAGLSAAGRGHVLRTLGRLGVDVWEETPVVALERGAAVVASGEALPLDLCLWAGPFAAAPVAAEAGLAVNDRGQVRVDAGLRSISHPRIYAVGDGAAIEGFPLRMACATAMPLGAHGADNVARELEGADPFPFRFGYVFQCLSLGRADGLIQWVAADDTPQPRVWTGRRAAWTKERVCRYTVTALLAQKWGLPYYWPKGQPRAEAKSASKAPSTPPPQGECQ